MAIPQFNSFRRYTPPTCTLEIYHPQPFWGRWRDQSFPPLFSFQLHFDDPRLAKDDRISIIGDRNLLETLRIKLQKYVNQYLNQSTITNELSSEVPTKLVTDVENVIHFSRQSRYSHLLYYQSFAPHAEIIEVVLNNTQLLDLINALEAFHWDATQVKVIGAKATISPRLGIALFATVTSISGFWWWQYQQNDGLVIKEQNISSQSKNTSQNFPTVIPPSPLDMNQVPETVIPKIPPELINQKTLSPPPIASNSPNLSVPNRSSNQKSTNDSTSSSTLNVLPDDSSAQNKQPQSLIKERQNISISPLASLPNLSSSNTNSSSLSSNENQHKEENIAILSPPLQKNLPNNSIDNSKNNPSANLKQHISYSDSTRKISQDISAEVKQYFQGKWQVPDNLTQSIEYRLQVEDNGSLSKVTPVGQVAAIFLQQTPIPAKNEIITSPFTELPYLTVRLILSPNGGVKTFAE